MSSQPLSKKEIEELKEKMKDQPTKANKKEKNLRTQFLVAYDHQMMKCRKCGELRMCYSSLCIDHWVESQL